MKSFDLRFRLGWLFLLIALGAIISLYLASCVFVPNRHRSAESLLSAFVAAQATGDENALLSLMYRPDTSVSYGKQHRPVRFALNPNLSIRDSALTELPPGEDGSAISNLTPTPMGRLNIQFEPEFANGPRKSLSCYYGEINGRYYISTSQIPMIAE